MATLSEALRRQQQKTLKRGPGGQLTEETPEEIQTLAGQAGLQAPPTTAIGASGIGANADQQKMMGTPAQKQAAQSFAQAPVESGLAAAMRRGQARTDKTAEEEAQEQKSEDMQNLGSLGTRVTDFINAQRQALQAQAQQVTAQNTLGVQAQGQFQGKDIVGIKNLLQTYREQPNNQEVLLELNKALGYDINRQLSPEEVDQLYESAVDTISRGGAGNIDDDLTVTDLLQNADFGYDLPTLSNLLGLPEDQISKMNVGQLRSEINRVGEQEFSSAQELGQKAESGLLGQAERGLARQAGREASATGVRATEADYANLEQQISQADKVFFGGKEYNVDELLQDENISNIIKDYMESGPDSELRQQIDKFEPKLKEFIEKNASVLEEASQKMEAGAGEFRSTQDFNKSLQTIGGIKMQDSLIDAFLPQSRQLQSSKIDPEKVPVYAASQGLSPQEQQSYMNNLNVEVQNDPRTIEDLKELNTQEIKAWQIGGGDSSPWQTNYLKPKRTYERIARTGDDPEELVKIATADKLGAQQAAQKLIANRGIDTLFGGGGSGSSLIDINGDGNIDSPSSMKAQLLSANPRPGLKGGPGSNKVLEPVSIKEPNQLDDRQRKIYGILSKYTDDGQVQDQDINEASGSLDLDDMIYLQDIKGKGRIDSGAVDRIHGQKRAENTGGVLKSINDSGGSRQDRISKMRDELNRQGERRLDKGQLEAEMTRLAKEQIEEELAEAKALRQNTRTRIRQQKQLISLAVPFFAALPPEVQDGLMDSFTSAGGAALDEIKKVDWDPKRTGPENLAVLARQLTTAPHRAAFEGAVAGLNSVADRMGGPAGGAIKTVTGGASNVAGAVTGGGGCFQAGTMFLMLKPDSEKVMKVEDIQPGDYMLLGGRVIATAQFVGNEIYNYRGIIVNGSHAVLENNEWTRVRNSELATRRPELDGIKVYVVWNEHHRMVSVDGTIWTDYAETDSTVAEIEEHRNLEILNS